MNTVFSGSHAPGGYRNAFIDKRNEPILVTMLDEKKEDQLYAMYLGKIRRNIFNGLPPVHDDACRKWIGSMITTALANIVALSFEQGIIGHAALFRMDDKRVEMIIVVDREFQDRGIGTQLTESLIQLAYEVGYENIWLSVDSRNFVAQHIYLKCGFEFLSMNRTDEVCMGFNLQRYRDIAKAQIKDIMNQKVIYIKESDTCRLAIGLFLKNPVGALPVVDNQRKLVGILSETNLIMETHFHQRVDTVMTRQVVSIREDYTIAQVIRLCQSRKYRCYPVVDDDNTLIGVVGRKDLLAYYFNNL